MEQVQESMTCNFDRYVYQKNFKIGEGLDYEEALHSMYVKELICNNNCEVYNYIHAKMAEKNEL